MASPRFAWGIDVGNRALKAVKLVRDGSGALRVDDVDVIEHEHILSDAGDNKESLVTQSLNTFAAKHPEKGGAVAIGVSGQSSFARFIKLPPVEPKKIPEIVRFEAIQQIPFPLDDVEWAYQLFQDEGSPDVEVGIFAMRKELVNQHIGNFTNAGLNVQAVQMNPLAVYNAMRYDERIKGTTMIVDVGAENTDLIIAEGEQVWLRSIPVGGNNFTEALVKQFKLKFPKAEELKRNAATSKYTRQILQAMRPVFDSLVAEIQRSIGFYASVHRDSRINRVIALGGTFRLPGLMKFLQMQLQLDVQRFDALGAAPPADARVATLLNDNVLSVVSPYGLALQAMGEAKITSSLLPLQIRRERMWRDKTKWFAAAAALFVAGTGVAVGRYYYDRMQYESADPARREIAQQLGVAQQLSEAWKQVEEAGQPERENITKLQALTKLRQVQAEIQVALDKALPEPAPKADGARAERKVVMLNDQLPAYYEDLAPALAKDANGYYTMRTPDFIANAQTPNAPGGGGNAVYSGQGGITAIRARALAAGAAGVVPMGPPPGTVPGGEGVDPAAAAGKQRGFLLTLTATTPSKSWEEVANVVSAALVDQTKPEIGVKQPFRIERVELVSRVDMKSLPPELRHPMAAPARRTQPNMPAGVPGRRPGMMGGPYGGMMGEEGMFVPQQPFGGRRVPPNAAAGRRTPGAPANRFGQRPGAPGAPGTATDPNAEEQQLYHQMPAVDFNQLKNGMNGMNGGYAQEMAVDPNQPQPILDPITGEDATNDNRLTFLVAVVLDPPVLAPPAPAAPAEGGEGGEPPADAPPAEAEAASAAQ